MKSLFKVEEMREKFRIFDPHFFSGTFNTDNIKMLGSPQHGI